MNEQEIRAAHPDWTDEQVAAEVARTAEAPAPTEQEMVSLPKAEADALRRRVAESERAARKLEADKKAAEEAQAAEQGKWEELAKQREAELAQTRDQAARDERDARVSRIAARMKFVDPSDVVGRVTADEGADDSSVEQALERIAKASPHLVAKEAPAVPEIGIVHQPANAPSPTGPKPPAGKEPLRTQADVEALSQKEFEARYDEVQAVLKQ